MQVLRRSMLVAALALAVGLLLPTAALASPVPRITSATPSHVNAGAKGTFVVVVKHGAACQLTLSSAAHGSIRSAWKHAGKTGIEEFLWTVPKSCASCRVTAIVRCRGIVHAARCTFRVIGRKQGAKLGGRIAVIAIRATEPPNFGGLGGAGYPTYGSVMVPGSAWFGGHGVNVISNGQPKNETPPNDVYQCVELVNRFLTTEGFGPVIFGNANQLYANAPSAYYDHHPNGSGYVPVPGDVIVLGGTKYGHVVVVTKVDGGTIYVVEQNGSASGVATISLSGSTLGKENGMSVIGLLHAKANGTAPQPTPPSPPSPTPVGPYEMAFQANTFDLFDFGELANADTAQGMMPGTSPSITALAGGGFEMAFQANTGNLIVFGTAGNVNTQQGMKAGTSPSIAASPSGGFQVAFQANTGNLYIYNSATGPANLQQGMDNSTSPSIAALPAGGYEMAFQANTGNLIVFGTAGNVNTQQGMKAGTSPSIAASPSGGFQAAFQANTGNLYIYNSATGPANLQQGMDNHTSPSIAALPAGGYEMAFQANTGNLIVYGTAASVNTQQGMKAGTSPSIAASPSGGFQAAFQANTGNLYIYNSATGPANLQQGMDNYTSPSIAALP